MAKVREVIFSHPGRIYTLPRPSSDSCRHGPAAVTTRNEATQPLSLPQCPEFLFAGDATEHGEARRPLFPER